VQDASVNDWDLATEEDSAGEIERLWLEQRGRAAEILAAHKAQLDEIELRFAAQIELISSQLAAETATGEHHEELERGWAELEARQLQIQQEQEKTALEFQQWSDQLRQKQQELERRGEEIETKEQQAVQQESSLQTARQEQDAELEQIALRRTEIEEQEQRLAQDRQAFETERAALHEQRQRIAKQIKQHRTKQLEELEQQRAKEHQELQEQYAEQFQALEQRRAELESTEHGELGELRKEIDRLAAAALQHQQAYEAQAAENARQLSELETARQKNAGLQDELDAAQQEVARLLEELDAALQESVRLKTELDSAGQENARLQDELQAAGELAHGAEEQLASLRAAHDSLAHQVAAREADSVAGHTQMESIVRERDQLAQRLNEANTALETVRMQAAKAGQTAEAARMEIAKQLEDARQEADDAAQRIAELENQLAAGDADGADVESGIDSQQFQDLQRRFELAVEDVRGLKRRNAELEDQITALKAGRSDLASAAQGQDWESLKKRMLAELEADGAPTAEREEEKLSIENTIRITDDVVAQKDREIQELKEVLNQQSDNLGSVAVGAAAVEEMFNQDELIRQERERLQQAQTEWRDKLRQAEIDISLERARIARERVELEEKLRSLEAERDQGHHAGHGHDNKTGKPSRGRWLERLGLKETDSK
jgi:chromosome segregation ATPase